MENLGGKIELLFKLHLKNEPASDRFHLAIALVLCFDFTTLFIPQTICTFHLFLVHVNVSRSENKSLEFEQPPLSTSHEREATAASGFHKTSPEKLCKTFV